MTKTSLIGLALFAAVSTATPTAAIAYEPVTLTSIVETADLDLSSVSGQRALDRRIAEAARAVCGEASNVDLEGRNAVRDCRSATIAQAAAQRDQVLAGAGSGSTIRVASAR